MMQSRVMQPFVFRNIYSEVAIVEELLNSEYTFQRLPWDDPEFLAVLSKYSKFTLLHHFVLTNLSNEEGDYYWRRSYYFVDEHGERQQMRLDTEAMLAEYGIQVRPYDDFVKENSELPEGFDDEFKFWYHTHYDEFFLLWHMRTEEIFHILFANRPFLLNFNNRVSEYLRSGKVAIPAEYLDDKGVLKRQTYLPPWLRNAVYCRDHGRCVFCQKDLSGLLSTDRQVHYDHMVPLNLFGTNDPCNLQLLCDTCNLKKGGTSSSSASVYPAWWT
jgi:hypothetical protein